MFEYLSEKILTADFKYDPFKHLEINNIFNQNHFKNIVNSEDIKFPEFKSDVELIKHLENSSYNAIEFPGCITNTKDYLKWHKNKSGKVYNVSSTEGFGMTYRLKDTNSEILNNLIKFFESESFKNVVAEKFSINLKDVTFDQGIQKYLDGYEISPHPDLRSKALTYMININPSKDSEKTTHHTHYMKFKNEYKYIQEYWKGNEKSDRCWVPWNWCETIKRQTKNNSIVIFAPDNDTLHAVDTNYSHLKYQRTQMYGNFWFKKDLIKIKEIKAQPKWENYIIDQSNQAPKNKITKIISGISKKIINKIK